MADNSKTAFLLGTDGSKKEVVPKNGSEFKLPELYEMLECELVQVLPTPESGMMMIFDEEGKMKDNEVNLQATVILEDYLFVGDVIVGKALYCPRELFS